MVYLPEEDSYLLISAIRKHLKSKNETILEMGAGSGVVSIYLSDYVSKIYAVDIDKEAITYAREEIRKASSRREKPIKNIHLINSDLFSSVGKELRFDLIVFNPPYLPNEKKIENDIALNGGPEGNEIIIKFLEQAKDYLNINGEIQGLNYFSAFSSEIENVSVNIWIGETTHTCFMYGSDYSTDSAIIPATAVWAIRKRSLLKK
jgi:release factor glutamine methyltransferase